MRHKTIIVAALLLFVPAGTWAASENSRSDATLVIGAVQACAERGNVAEIAKFMSENFQYSFGASPSKDKALAHFRAHPELMKEMATIIAQGCRETTLEKQEYYVCPPQFTDPGVIYLNFRAGFRKQANGNWVFEFFVAGD